MAKKEYSELYYGDDESAGGYGYQNRMAMFEKPDGTYRVVKQVRSGGDGVSKFFLAFMSAGLIIPRLFKWRDKSIVNEYATRDEAKQILKDFDDNIRDTIARSQTCHIPLHQRERYAKENGIAVSPKLLKEWTKIIELEAGKPKKSVASNQCRL